MKIDLLYMDTLFLAEFSYLISKSTCTDALINKHQIKFIYPQEKCKNLTNKIYQIHNFDFS